MNTKTLRGAALPFATTVPTAPGVAKSAVRPVGRNIYLEEMQRLIAAGWSFDDAWEFVSQVEQQRRCA